MKKLILSLFSALFLCGIGGAAPAAAPDAKEPAAPKTEANATPKTEAEAEAEAEAPSEKPAPDEAPEDSPDKADAVDQDDTAAMENADAESAAVAKPVSAEPVQVYGWREYIHINGIEEKLTAKLDTGAYTSSIHAEEKELFERDGKKWVRFIVTDPTDKKPERTRIEAPLVRIAMIKEPGAESVPREVVRLGFQIGERKMRGDFTLNNRANMLAPVLVGRTLIRDLGLVDPGRTHLADKKVFR
jgi:hypothetical protein